MKEIAKSLLANLADVKVLIYYIIAAVGGGLVKEINTPHKEPQTLKAIFARGFTGVWIAIIFGLGTEAVTDNIKLSIAVTALAGVSGYEALQWLTRFLRTKAENTNKKC